MEGLHIPGWTGLLEILFLAVAFYYIILFFRGTRGAQMLLGFVVLMISLLVLTHFSHLNVLNWILGRFSVYLAVAFVVIFQPEIRRALAELGKQHVFSPTVPSRTLVDHMVQAVLLLAGRKMGALLAVEREISTRPIQETGTAIDSLVTAELLTSIFYPHTPLHDGGVVICHDRIKAAGCLFPLSQREELSKELGTRHRAAIGMTEETDALVVVVSEETGTISVAFKGRLSRGLDEERLRRMLSAVLLRAPRARNRWRQAGGPMDLSPAGMVENEKQIANEFADYG
ncbi:MAG: diadenylate cyclase CdaA [Kiritimatiellaeota bacterium]|nr:diadenylate cyclase CdaA [Kiritimatiellota bacterium]